LNIALSCAISGGAGYVTAVLLHTNPVHGAVFTTVQCLFDRYLVNKKFNKIVSFATSQIAISALFYLSRSSVTPAEGLILGSAAKATILGLGILAKLAAGTTSIVVILVCIALGFRELTKHLEAKKAQKTNRVLSKSNFED
jgi:hypothetical protein